MFWFFFGIIITLMIIAIFVLYRLLQSCATKSVIYKSMADGYKTKFIKCQNDNKKV